VAHSAGALLAPGASGAAALSLCLAPSPAFPAGRHNSKRSAGFVQSPHQPPCPRLSRTCKVKANHFKM